MLTMLTDGLRDISVAAQLLPHLVLKAGNGQLTRLRDIAILGRVPQR